MQLETYDLRTPGQRLTALIATVERQSAELTRLNHQYVRLLERQEKIERMFALLSQIQGELALQTMDEDDLEMEPGVAVWTPEDVDDD